MHKRLAILLPLIALFVFVKPALAGGGPVALTAFPLKPFDQTKTFILHAEIFTEESCSTLKPSFAFTDAKNGDSITPYVPPSDGTFITRHWFTTFKWAEICDFYMQAKSGTLEQRTATVTITVNGETEKDDTQIAYGDDYYSKQLQSFGRINDADNTPQIDVISEKYLGGQKREIVVQWQKVSWAEKYAIFDQMLDDNGNVVSEYGPFPPTSETKAILNISASSSFYLTVKACGADDPCTTLGSNPYSIYLDKMRNISQSPTGTTKQTPNVTQKVPEITPTASSQNDEKIEELNKKVAQLEGKLEDSQKKQSALEERFNNLLSWIKSHLPFFN